MLATDWLTGSLFLATLAATYCAGHFGAMFVLNISDRRRRRITQTKGYRNE